jgi:hypothetical protein
MRQGARTQTCQRSAEEQVHGGGPNRFLVFPLVTPFFLSQDSLCMSLALCLAWSFFVLSFVLHAIVPPTHCISCPSA